MRMFATKLLTLTHLYLNTQSILNLSIYRLKSAAVAVTVNDVGEDQAVDDDEAVVAGPSDIAGKRPRAPSPSPFMLQQAADLPAPAPVPDKDGKMLLGMLATARIAALPAVLGLEAHKRAFPNN